MNSNGFNMGNGSEARTTPSFNTEWQLPIPSSSQSNGHSPYFQNLPPLVSSSGAARMQGALLQNLQHHHHHNNMNMHAHQQHHFSIHRPTNPYANQHLQHQLMEGNHHHHHYHHHQAQQMNLSQQPSNAHLLFSQLHPIPPAQVPHHSNNILTNSQRLTFGFNFKYNVIRNGTAYINNQMGNFRPIYHNQFGNQQQTLQHSLQQHASCFAQNPRMYMQPEPLAAALTAASRSPSSTVCWMTSQPSTASSSNMAPNNFTTLERGASTEASTPNISNSAHLDPPNMSRIITPDPAQYRGYYTACELLQLKRTLEMRMGCCSIPVPKTASATTRRTLVKDIRKCTKGPKIGNKINNRVSVITFNESNGNGQKCENKEPEQQGKADELSEQNRKENEQANMEQDIEDLNYVEPMEALNTVQNQVTPTHPDVAPITEIYVPEVIDLTSDGDDDSTDTSRDDNDETEEVTYTDDETEDETCIDDESEDKINTDDETEGETNSDHEENGQDQVERAGVEMNKRGNLESNGLTQNSTNQCKSGVTGKKLAMLPLLPPISDMRPKNQLPMGNTPSGATATSGDDKNKDMAADENHEQLLSVIPSTTVTTPQATTSGGRSVHIYTTGHLGNYGGPLQNRIRHPTGSAMRFRSSSLVLKRLEIGSCTIRSFSCLNPNRLHVLYNLQRFIYECLLPITRDSTPNATLMRKILRMEIGFEQISQIKFGQDNVRMRVEGKPVLTLSTSPALNEPDQVLTPVDKVLLEKIDKGQLYLIPTHQLYFLNERFVQQLEFQFRKHPSFQHLFIEHE